jgi:hypothetical protein
LINLHHLFGKPSCGFVVDVWLFSLWSFFKLRKELFRVQAVGLSGSRKCDLAGSPEKVADLVFVANPTLLVALS